MKSISIFCVGFFVTCTQAFVIYPNQHHRGWSSLSPWGSGQRLPSTFRRPTFGRSWYHNLNYGYGRPMFRSRFNFGSMSPSVGLLPRVIRQPFQIRPSRVGGRSIRIGSIAPTRRRLVARRRQLVRPVLPSRISGGLPTLSEFRSGPQVSRQRIVRERLSRVYNGNNNNNNNNNNNGRKSSPVRARTRRPDAIGANGNEVLAIFALDQAPALSPTVSKETKKSDIKVDDIHAAAAKAAEADLSTIDNTIEATVAKAVKETVLAPSEIDSKKIDTVGYIIDDVPAAQLDSLPIEGLPSVDAVKSSLKEVVAAEVSKTKADLVPEAVAIVEENSVIDAAAAVVAEAASQVIDAAATDNTASKIVAAQSEIKINIKDSENANAEIVITNPVTLVDAAVPVIADATKTSEPVLEAVVVGETVDVSGGIPIVGKTSKTLELSPALVDVSVPVDAVKKTLTPVVSKGAAVTRLPAKLSKAKSPF